MLASLLPGLRELRAPLAAGYVWLLFVFLVAGSPTETQAIDGPIQNVVIVVPALGTTAAAVAVSFVAYLVGSVSQDLFGQLLPRAVTALRRRLPKRPTLLELQLTVTTMFLDDHVRDRNASRATELLNSVQRALYDARLAGASEAVKPEAQRPMVEAEQNLRLAIVPPIAAVMGYLSLQDSLWWLFGLLFATALFIQAVARSAEATQLAAMALRAGEVEYIESRVGELARKVAAQGIDDEIASDLHDLDRELERLKQSL